MTESLKEKRHDKYEYCEYCVCVSRKHGRRAFTSIHGMMTGCRDDATLTKREGKDHTLYRCYSNLDKCMFGGTTPIQLSWFHMSYFQTVT